MSREWTQEELFRLFIFDMNITPIKYALRRRLYYAARELVSNEKNISNIAYSFGFEGGIDYDTIHYCFEKWTTSQNKYKPDIHIIDSHFPESFVWKSYAPIWEYYSPNKDCDVYEERIYMPIKLNTSY